MPDVEWNRAAWNQHWSRSGDEWSAAWGGVRAQWYGSIFPRISPFLPAHRILEIAPGRGRWSQFLLQHCVEYFGIDLSEKCIESCKLRFVAASRAHFSANDGTSLQMIPDNSIDFVFSFDSLVHAELDVLQEYIWQILRKLTSTGVAFLHHSNARGDNGDDIQARANARARSVSSSLVRELIEDCSGRPLIQEEINWAGKLRIDCITTFCRLEAFPAAQCKLLRNNEFMMEANLVREYQNPYHSL